MRIYLAIATSYTTVMTILIEVNRLERTALVDLLQPTSDLFNKVASLLLENRLLTLASLFRLNLATRGRCLLPRRTGLLRLPSPGVLLLLSTKSEVRMRGYKRTQWEIYQLRGYYIDLGRKHQERRCRCQGVHLVC